jgi:hypothetical protein
MLQQQRCPVTRRTLQTNQTSLCFRRRCLVSGTVCDGCRVAAQARHVSRPGGMQAIASLSRGVGAALQGVVRGVVRSQASEAGPARPGGQEEADSRLGNILEGRVP